MALPTPQQFENVVLSENDAVCDQLQKMVTLSKLISDVYAEIYKDNGDLTDDFLAKVCALDCTGQGGSTTEGTTEGTTEATTPAPTPGVDPDIYMFYSKVVGGNLNGFFRVVDGTTFDSTRVVNYGSEIAVTTNEVVVASALHPTTGVLWVAYGDGTLGTSTPVLKLGTVNKATGAITAVANVNRSAVNETFTWAGNQWDLHMDFDRSDNTLWLVKGFEFGQVNTTTAEWSPLLLGTPSAAAAAMDSFISAGDGTFYMAANGTVAGPTNTVILNPDKTDSDPLYTGKIPFLNTSNKIDSLTSAQQLVLRRGEFSVIDYNASQTTWFRTDATPSNVFSLGSITPTITANLTSDMPDLMAVACNAT